MSANPPDIDPNRTPRTAPVRGVIAIVPAFNSIETLADVLDGVERHGLPLLVVDDGSTDGTAAWLAEWEDASVGAEDRDSGREIPPTPARHVVVQRVNGGKGKALMAGFTEARRLGYDAAVTLDADGQHDPDDLPRLLEMAERAGPTALIRGRRDDGTTGYPWRRLLGRRLNDLAIRAQTGLLVRDSPCGYRLYPLRLVEAVHCRSGRYAWEEELITRAAWSGWAIREVPVACRYAGDGEARSHYRFHRDWPQGFAINLLLLARAALPIPRSFHRSGPHREPTLGARVNDFIGIAMLRRARTDPIERWRLGATFLFGLALATALATALSFPLLWIGALLMLWLSWRWHAWLPAMAAGAVIGWMIAL